MKQSYRVRTLLVFVVLQCVFHGINLRLLPMWGDETFTVVTAAQTPTRIIGIVRADIHPPLYFLLAHWWNRIPVGSDPLVRLRALSALFAILATSFIDRRWLRGTPETLRIWFLLFWTFSPCLLLYSRMARSYTMQVLVAAVAIWYLLRLAEDAAGWKNLAAFASTSRASTCLRWGSASSSRLRPPPTARMRPVSGCEGKRPVCHSAATCSSAAPVD